MATIPIRTGNGDIVNIKASGSGTELDPYLPTQDVNLQDQTSPILIVPFKKDYLTTTLTAPVAVDDKVINVADATGVAVGDHVRMFSTTNNTFYQGKVVSIATLAITVDTPVDKVYATSDVVGFGKINLAVNGAVTPQVFNIRAPDPGITVVGDITRIILTMETVTQPEWNLFGDIARLTNGIVFRKTDGTTQNIFNVKSNSELAGIMYDMDFLEFSRFASYGLKGRLTFGGQNKIGVVIRLEVDEDLELVIQDDLTGLTNFYVVAEGHVTVP